MTAISGLAFPGSAFAGAAFSGSAAAKRKGTNTEGWQAARHDKDDWFDKVPGKHRLVFDTTTYKGFGEAILYANNFIVANKSDYGLDSNELALVIIARHTSTPFAFNDAMWAKYGRAIVEMAPVEDPHTKQAPTVNIYNATGYGMELPSFGVSVSALAKQGVQFAVCSMATHGFTEVAAKRMGISPETLFNELTSNLIGNARMVPAGIVAVNRAQERGYTLVTT